MKDSTKEIKDNTWNSINVLIVTLTMLGGIMFLMYTNGITSLLFNIGLPVNIALVLFYKIFQKYGHFRKIVIFFRIVCLCHNRSENQAVGIEN